VIHLRIVIPGTAHPGLLTQLRDDPRTANLVVLSGCAVDPAGDLILIDVAREATSDVIAGLRANGLNEHASIAIQEVDAIFSTAADRAEQAAPGSPDDGIVWDQVQARARADARSSWAYYVFMCLATLIASIAVLTDSSVLVVGAMVVGPEFGPVAATAVGLVLRERALVRSASSLLVSGFVVGIVVTSLVALMARVAGWITAADLTRPRPLTGFIWAPDRWSVVVALLAGAAGVLSLTAGRTNVLVGVFISVTTIPAAGNLALAVALGVGDEITGAATQLGVNLAGMIIAGCLVLALQRFLTVGRTASRFRTRSSTT
jgi:uncharacterized hydrophobic protein (TIGR00271 family)